MHMLRSGARWRDCPPEYGPYTTIYNRFNRWSRQGIWLDMFKALTGSAAVFGTPQSTVLTSKHTAPPAAEKGGLRRSDRALARRPHDRDPRVDRRTGPAADSARRAGQHARCHDGSRTAVRRGLDQATDCRQSLRYQPLAQSAGATRNYRRHPLDHEA